MSSDLHGHPPTEKLAPDLLEFPADRPAPGEPTRPPNQHPFSAAQRIVLGITLLIEVSLASFGLGPAVLGEEMRRAAGEVDAQFILSLGITAATAILLFGSSSLNNQFRSWAERLYHVQRSWLFLPIHLAAFFAFAWLTLLFHEGLLGHAQPHAPALGSDVGDPGAGHPTLLDRSLHLANYMEDLGGPLDPACRNRDRFRWQDRRSSRTRSGILWARSGAFTNCCFWFTPTWFTNRPSGRRPSSYTVEVSSL